MNGAAHAGRLRGLLFPAAMHPTVGMTQGCQGLTDPMTITAAEGNLILEIEGRSPIEILEQALAEPRNRGLGQITGHLLAGIGDIVSVGRSDYVVRPFAVAEADPRLWRSPSRSARARRSASRCATRSARATT